MQVTTGKVFEVLGYRVSKDFANCLFVNMLYIMYRNRHFKFS